MTFNEFCRSCRRNGQYKDLAEYIIMYAQAHPELSQQQAFFDEVMENLNEDFYTEDKITLFVNKIFLNQTLGNILMPHIIKLLEINTAPYGLSTDNWSKFARLIFNKLKESEINNRRSQVVSDFLSDWKEERKQLKDQLEKSEKTHEAEFSFTQFIPSTTSKASTAANPLSKDWEFVRIQGRTILFRNNESGNIMAVKIKKKNESVVELHKQKNMANFLKNNKQALGLKSEYPAGICVAETKDIHILLANLKKQNKINSTQINELEKMIEVEKNGTAAAYVYITESEQYFTYLHDPSLSEKEFFHALQCGVNDIFVLYKNQVIYHQLADLFHYSGSSFAPRADHGKYIALTNLLYNHPFGTGKIEDFLKAVKYVNLRGSGLADEGDFHKAETLSKTQGKFSQKFFEPKQKSHIQAELLAEVLLVMELTTISYALQVIEQDKSKDTEAFWESLTQQLCETYRASFSLLSGMPESTVNEFFNDTVWDYKKLAKQMRYFLTNQCVQEFERDNPQIPSGIFPENTTIKTTPTVAITREHEDFFKSKKNGKPDTGHHSGQHLVKEGDMIRYSFVTFISCAWRCEDKFKEVLREAKKNSREGNDQKAESLFREARNIHASLYKKFEEKIVNTHPDNVKEEKYSAYRKHCKLC